VCPLLTRLGTVRSSIELLKEFWGPMPIMIWLAAGVEVLEEDCISPRHRSPAHNYTALQTLAVSFINTDQPTFPDTGPDFAVLLVLLLANGLLGWYENMKAGDAIQKLKESLTLKCVVRRDGRPVDNFKVEDLVPGDCVLLTAGGPIPVSSEPADAGGKAF
jgi:magnesium-transporting ATPase (P-type)